MKTEEFTKKLAKHLALAPAKATYTHKQIKDIYIENNRYGDININKMICIEELSELTKEISKQERGTGNYFDLVQEMADVKNILASLQIIYDISDDELDAAQTIKMQRLEKWIEEEKGKTKDAETTE